MKNKKIIYILIGLVVVFAIFITVVKVVFGNRKEKIKEVPITFQGIDLTLLSNIEHKEEMGQTGKMELILNTKEWKATLAPIYDQYDHILSYPTCTQRTFLSYGATLGEIKKNDGDGRKYIYYTFESEGEKYISAFYRITENVIVYFYIENKDNVYDKNALQEVFKILSTAKYTGTDNQYNYNEYQEYYFHQCHDIDKIDPIPIAE